MNLFFITVLLLFFRVYELFMNFSINFSSEVYNFINYLYHITNAIFPTYSNFYIATSKTLIPIRQRRFVTLTRPIQYPTHDFSTFKQKTNSTQTTRPSSRPPRFLRKPKDNTHTHTFLTVNGVVLSARPCIFALDLSQIEPPLYIAIGVIAGPFVAFISRMWFLCMFGVRQNGFRVRDSEFHRSSQRVVVNQDAGSPRRKLATIFISDNPREQIRCTVRWNCLVTVPLSPARSVVGVVLGFYFFCVR